MYPLQSYTDIFGDLHKISRFMKLVTQADLEVFPQGNNFFFRDVFGWDVYSPILIILEPDTIFLGS